MLQYHLMILTVTDRLTRVAIRNWKSVRIDDHETNWLQLYERPIEIPSKNAADKIQVKIKLGKKTLQIEREQLAFSLSSFVAECGGTLGLFIGFNFVMIWDFVIFLAKTIADGSKLRDYLNKE